ncbi:MAG: (Fe-S)-binding protein [Gammaproteobacteria bacterium]|nr:(Fe-S)-binding protein [Gammaproteobacteria bacterium]
MSGEQAAFAEFRESLARLAADAPANDMTDEVRADRARATFMARLDRQTAIDLDTCIHCGMCAEACHFYIATNDERFTPAWKVDPLRRFYRREVSPMRIFNRLFTKKVDADDLREWRELVYDACTGCGRCDMMCPIGINISSAIAIMREGIAAAGLVPDELAALQREQQEKNTVFGVGIDELRSLVSELSAKGADIPIDKPSAEILALTTAVEIRLFPESIAATAKIMNKVGADWTLATGAFEATNLGLISGDRGTRVEALKRISDQARAIGARTVVVPESGHAYQALRWEAANDLGESLPFDVLAISEFIAAQVEKGTLQLKAGNGLSSVAYHDPCRLARHGGVFDEPRAVLAAMGLDVRETESNRRENLCCGGGCGEYAIGHSAPIRQKAFELKRHELDHTDADAVVTGCNNCRINLMTGAANSGWEGKVVSLAETVAENLAE